MSKVKKSFKNFPFPSCAEMTKPSPDHYTVIKRYMDIFPYPYMETQLLEDINEFMKDKDIRYTKIDIRDKECSRTYEYHFVWRRRQ